MKLRFTNKEQIENFSLPNDEHEIHIEDRNTAFVSDGYYRHSIVDLMAQGFEFIVYE